MTMIKIMHIITTLSSGGAESALYRLISNSHRGPAIEHAVVSLTGQGIYGSRLKRMGIPVYCLGMKPGSPDPRKVIMLYRLIRRFHPHILQTWLYHADLLGLLVGRFARVSKIVWNVRCSEVFFEDYAPTTRWVFGLLKRLSHAPDAIIVNSIAGKEFHVRAGYRPKRWAVIPNGFETERYRPSIASRNRVRQVLGLDESIRIIGMVARFDPMKDHANFFAAAGRLSSVYHDVCFVLCGRGMDPGNDDIQRMIKNNDLEGRVYLLGERSDMHAIFPGLDINTLTSLGEGFPNVLGEAMACGVPCVATDVGDASYIIGNTGRIVPPGNPEALSGAWGGLLSISPEQRAGLGLKARKRIEDNFSISKTVRQYEQLYCDVLQ